MNKSNVFEGSENVTFVKYSNNGHVIFSIALLMSLAATFTVLSNCTVFIAMVQTLVKDGRRGSMAVSNSSRNSIINMFLMLSMTLSGVMVGGFVMPLSLLKLISNGRWPYGYSLCAVNVSTDNLLCAVSTLHVLFMAVDTYLIVCKPLAYRQLTNRTAYVMIAAGWLLPLVLALLWRNLQEAQLEECLDVNYVCQQFSNVSIFNVICGILFFGLFLMVIVLYLLIMHSVIEFKQRSYHRTNNNVLASTYTQNISEESNPNSNACPSITAAVLAFDSRAIQAIASKSEVSASKKVRANIKCFRFIGIIFMTYSICWLPTWIFYLLHSSCTISLPEWALLFLDWLTYFSCTVNPILYCSNKSIKKSVQSLLCKYISKK